MSTSSHNDQIFAKFMVALSKRIIHRHDTRQEAYDHCLEALQKLAGRKYISTSATTHTHSMVHTVAPAIIGIDPAALSQTDITESELEVIRAYHAGEEVLAVLLSQDR